MYPPELNSVRMNLQWVRVEESAGSVTQRKKGDSLAEGYVSELWNFTCISVTQNSLQELKKIWDQWNDEVRQLFYSNYRDLPYLLDMKLLHIRESHLVPTVEEYMALLRCSKIQVDRAYSRAKGDRKCIPWKNLKDIILAHPDTKKRVDVFALSIYGLVVFPKALGHVDEVVTDLFDQLDKRVTLVQGILNVDKVSYWVFSENFLPLKEVVATLRRDDISEEKWMAVLQNLQEEDVEWRAPWLLPDEILYLCGDFDWVPL
ncbi:hypothetical protein Goshw_028852 [Gossypium schwendimanii]|uniref:DUF7745 domain-containing protein n=1 Tax=Gossypium schwendimanii TaxID=34291 RepID=A0A7J9LII2_GOSSC|nr:hypothetical protein [Gossypium schwendimanii]